MAEEIKPPEPGGKEVVGYKVDEEAVKKLVETFDPELRFRKLRGWSARVAVAMCVILSIFHIETAGFGVLQEWKHRCFHLAFVLPLIFLVYPTRKIAVKRPWLTWIYETVYSLLGATMLTLGLRDIFKLGAPASALVFVLGFYLAFAMKTRDLWRPQRVSYLDLAASLIGLGAMGYTLLLLSQHWSAYVEQSPAAFVAWTFLILAGLILPLLFMLGDSLRILTGAKKFHLDPSKVPYFEMSLAVLAFALSTYIILDFDAFIQRAGYPNIRDLVIGNFAILLVLEGTRRSIGLPLAILGIAALALCYLGPYLTSVPGLAFFAHRGFSPSRIIDQMYLGTEGIYGIPLGVVATFVFHFVLFGIFTMKTGLGKLFIDLATALAGWSAGGPAKVSVLASGLLGCISGSSVANTVTTGAFTIPMMKKMGYRKEFAGAVEAAASTGGQLMPPIMGAAAFIMAEFLGISYLTIATCAIVPAFMHFFAVGWMVHLEAKRTGMKGIPREQLPKVKTLMKENGTLLIPLVMIIWLLVTGFTPFLAAFWGIIGSVALGQSSARTRGFFISVCASLPLVIFQWNPFQGPFWAAAVWTAFVVGGMGWIFRRSPLLNWLLGAVAVGIQAALLFRGSEAQLAAFWSNFFVIVVGLILNQGRMKIAQVIECLEWGTKNALAIGAACAAVGLIVGTTTLTGLGLKIASATIYLASQTAAAVATLDVLQLFHIDQFTLVFTLLYTAFACLVLGMGLPTTPNYIVVSIIAAPALLQFGVAPLMAHMFVFYFGIMADLTPPVAVAAYAASGISQGDPFKTGVRAFTLAWAEMYVPFAFIFTPVLILMPWILDKPRGLFPWLDFIFVFITVLLGIVALGAIVIGYFADHVSKAQRVLLGVALILLWWHETVSSLLGAGLLASIYIFQLIRKKKWQALYGSPK